MHKLEKTEYGMKIVMSGFFSPEESKRWGEEAMKLLKEMPSSFHVLVDASGYKPGTQNHVNNAVLTQEIFKEKGMNRSAVILDSTSSYFQVKDMAKESGIFSTIRFFDASKGIDCEPKALRWLIDGIEPD